MGFLTSLNLKKEGRIAEKWSFNVGTHLLCGPSVHDNGTGTEEILIGTKNGKVILIDQNANQKWEYNVDEKIDTVDLMFMDAESVNSIFTAPSAHDIDGDGKKEILFGTQLGTVYALSAEGKLLWKFSSGSSIRGGICVADVNNDGKMEIIFGSDDKKLYVLTNKGKLIWNHDIGTGIQSTPAVSMIGKAIVFGDDEGKINCISFERKLLWSYPTGGKIVAEAAISPLFGGDTDYVIAGSTDNAVYALDLSGGLRWSYKTGGSIIAKPIVLDVDNDGKMEMLISSCDNNIYMITRDGQKIWSYETNFWIGSPAVALDLDDDGRMEVIVGSYDHSIYVLNGEGSYVLDHIPGLSHIINQAGHYSDVQSQDPGENIGKKIWQYSVPDIVMGIACLKKTIIVAVKTGKVICLSHTK
jgi:outer membrane protein assembly factor BamB